LVDVGFDCTPGHEGLGLAVKLNPGFNIDNNAKSGNLVPVPCGEGGRMAQIGRLEAVIENAHGRAPVLLTCEHASNFMPPGFGGLGLGESALAEHVAWDIGAHGLALRMAQFLDAPLVAAPASRLLVDPNRKLDAHDLIPEKAEGAPIPGNAKLNADERAARVAAFHVPFHEAIDAQLKRGPHIEALAAVHSFTPVFHGEARPWHVGILHAEDTRLADAMLETLSGDASLVVGRNQPYAPEQGVFYTMDRHAGLRATVMIEVRNDLIRDEIGQTRWARALADALNAALAGLAGGSDRAAPGAIGGRK
jgi:predicted N-formylglutamate amidohydrolase